ncbi:MAG TPA: group 1 truncated hemoglobin [Polyangiaceae bacterium]|jgi:hemoglobin|nr:group 1 truncated hemoglobin [Polyangiaceae bacterium]
MEASLYERIGGEAAVMAAVDIFYQKVIADELTRPFFAGLDMDAQVKKQVSFMTWAFGGPEQYKGRDLRTAHAGLVSRGLSDQHFDAVAGHLTATLRELGVKDELIQEALTIVGGQRGAVLNR